MKLLILILIGVLCMFSAVSAASSFDVEAGNIFLATLTSNFDSLNWAGLKVINDGSPLADSQDPFVTIDLSSPVILEAAFPGDNLKDDAHYYAAMLPTSFDSQNLRNVSPGTDLESGQLFNAADFPQFYAKSYYDFSDNPKNTFCCDTENVTISGVNYTAFKLDLQVDVTYYVMKYLENGTATPLFVVPLQDYLCYNSTACVSEFLLPVSDTDYSFFVLSEAQSFDYDIYIDGVETTTFSQTAIPYNLTVRVKDLYTQEIQPNTSVLVGEDHGQNLFVPYTLSGYVAQAYAIGETDDQGFESFLVTPTVYPSIDNYTIYVAVYRDGDAVSREELTVSSKDALVATPKSFQPSRLQDNAVAAVNAMNQIVSFMFQWSSQLVEGLLFNIDYNVGTDTFTTYDLQVSQFISNPIELKTGAPNVISVDIINAGGTPPSSFSVRIKETDGYLVMNPYTDTTPLNATDRRTLRDAPVSTNFIVTPTSLGFIESNVTLEVINSTGSVIGSLDLTIDPDLNIDSPGSSYDNDLLKTIVNSMNQIINNMYNSMN